MLQTSSPALRTSYAPACSPSNGESFRISESALRLKLSGRNEPDLYHDTSAPDGTVFFALLTGTCDANGLRQRCYPISAMPLVLENLDPELDTWISQAEFFT